jgi:hypothetical protein
MITVFCDTRQFSAKNGVFVENQCFCKNSSSLGKNANIFAKFLAKIFLKP